MKLNNSALTSKFQFILAKIKRFRVILFMLFFLALYGYLVMRINNLIVSEPPAELVTEKTQTIKRIKVDQASIDKLLELEDQNVEVQALFQQARDNPFTE